MILKRARKTLWTRERVTFLDDDISSVADRKSQSHVETSSIVFHSTGPSSKCRRSLRFAKKESITTLRSRARSETIS